MSGHFLNCVVSSAVITLCTALLLGTAGCGGDDDDTEPVGGSSANADSGQNGTNTGQSGTNTGQSGTNTGQGGTNTGQGETDAQMNPGGEVADAGDPQPVICGDNECTVIPEGRPFIKPCCLEDMTCGASYLEDDECQVIYQVGDSDERCPGHAAPQYNNMTMRGCCKPDGKCGISSSFGFGCVERTQLTAYLGGPLPALDCDATDGDAGS